MLRPPLPLTALLLVAAAPLASMRGQHRVLLVFAPAAGDARLAEQDRLLAADRGLAERDMVVVRVAGGSVTGAGDRAAVLRRTYDVPVDAFAVRLVGKDGHVADRFDHPVPPAQLFATVDAMPMRQDEVRRRGR